MADIIPSPPPGTIAYAEWKRKQDQTQEPGNQQTGKEVGRFPTQEGSLEGGMEVSQEVGREASKESGKAPKESMEEKPVFKASFLYTEQEMELFEDLKLGMRRKHGLKVTKNDIARAGIRLVSEDYKKNQENSFLAKVSQAKPKT